MQSDSAVEAVKVFCRVKPSPQRDLSLRCEGSAALLKAAPTEEPTTFSFTDCFGPTAANADVFDAVGADACDAAIAGYNGAVLAYGQTASGKSHTILGSADDPGLVPRCLGRLFARNGAEDVSEDVRTVTVSFVEIYNERAYDLLERCAQCGGTTDDPEATRNQMKALFTCGHVICRKCAIPPSTKEAVCPACSSDPTKPRKRLLSRRGVSSGLPVSEVPGSGRYVGGASETEVTSELEVVELMKVGQRARKCAGTAMNEHSSRSHALLIASVHHRHIRSGRARTGQLYLCDLAGSESLGKSGSARLRETCHINTSLFTLGNVIEALAHNSKAHATQAPPVHVPYRNSKLTLMLSAALGGNAKTALIVTCAAEQQHCAETLATLRFGARAACISTRPTINAFQTPSALKLMLEEAQRTVGQQQSEILALRALVRDMQLSMSHHGLRYLPSTASLGVMRRAEVGTMACAPMASVPTPAPTPPPSVPAPPASHLPHGPPIAAADELVDLSDGPPSLAPTPLVGKPGAPTRVAALADVAALSDALAPDGPAVGSRIVPRQPHDGVASSLLECGPDVLDLVLSWLGPDQHALLACAATCTDLRDAASGPAASVVALVWKGLFVKRFGQRACDEAHAQARTSPADLGSRPGVSSERRLYAVAVRRTFVQRMTKQEPEAGAARGLMLRS